MLAGSQQVPEKLGVVLVCSPDLSCLYTLLLGKGAVLQPHPLDPMENSKEYAFYLLPVYFNNTQHKNPAGNLQLI